uniref:Secreted protein n=1 Tax=Steinernema glaseri TaxID=37863 RepID=A0A1I8A419_9BILA
MWTWCALLLGLALLASSAPLDEKRQNCDCEAIANRQATVIEGVGSLFAPSNQVEATCTKEESLLAGNHLFEFMGHMDAMESCAPSYPEFEVQTYNCTALNDLVSAFEKYAEDYVDSLNDTCRCGCEKNE